MNCSRILIAAPAHKFKTHLLLPRTSTSPVRANPSGGNSLALQLSASIVFLVVSSKASRKAFFLDYDR